MSLSLSLSLSLYLSLSIVFGHVMSSHHSEQMSQRSQVSILLLGNVLRVYSLLSQLGIDTTFDQVAPLADGRGPLLLVTVILYM